MSLTEQELRDSLRRATEAPPHVTDRVGAVERRVRRRRTRIVAGTAIAVVVALAAVPVARWLPDRLNRNDIASSDITPQQGFRLSGADEWDGYRTKFREPPKQAAE